MAPFWVLRRRGQLLINAPCKFTLLNNGYTEHWAISEVIYWAVARRIIAICYPSSPSALHVNKWIRSHNYSCANVFRGTLNFTFHVHRFIIFEMQKHLVSEAVTNMMNQCALCFQLTVSRSLKAGMIETVRFQWSINQLSMGERFCMSWPADKNRAFAFKKYSEESLPPLTQCDIFSQGLRGSTWECWKLYCRAVGSYAPVRYSNSIQTRQESRAVLVRLSLLF